MNENSLPPSLPLESPEDPVTQALRILKAIILTGEVPSPLPETLTHHPDFQFIQSYLLDTQQFTLALARGDLSLNLDQKGIAAGCLKSLQAGLRHLTWQAQMITKGHFDQRLNFMGDFSTAFNQMAESLETMRRELYQSEEYYRNILSIIPDGIAITNRHGEIEFATPQTYKLLEIPPDETLIGTPVLHWFDPSEHDWLRERLTHLNLIQGLREHKLLKYDRSPVWVELSSVLLTNTEGEVTGIMSVSHDITSRREAEENIRQANLDLQQRLNELSTLNRITQTMNKLTDLEQTLNGIIKEVVELLDTTAGGVTLLNADHSQQSVVAFYAKNDPTPHTHMGRDFPLAGNLLQQPPLNTGRALILNDIAASPFAFHLRNFSMGNQINAMMIVPIRAHGESIGMYVLLSDQPGKTFTPDEAELAETIAGQIAGALENAHLYNQARQAQEAAESANRAKSIFLANISHELRTPLNAILGFTQLMADNPNLTEQQRENLSIVSRSGEHLLTLINDILEMSRIESGRIELHPRPIDLLRLLLDLEEIFQLPASAKGLGLTIYYDPTIPRQLLVDGGKLRQILVNLLGNAVKFTLTGRVTLQVKRSHPPTEQTAPQHLYLQFTVTDTGIGIAPEDLPHLFEAFALNSQTRQSGSGLGLPICNQLIHLLGGSLTVESTVNQGSRFEFTIPVEMQALSLEKNAEEPTHRLDNAMDNSKITAALSTLPASLLLELKQATIDGDLEWMTILIHKTGEYNAELAVQLNKFLDNFELENILRLIQQSFPPDVTTINKKE